MIYQCSYCKSGAMNTKEQYSVHINGSKHKKKAFALQAPFAGIEYEEFRPNIKTKTQNFESTNEDFPSLSTTPSNVILPSVIQYGNIKQTFNKPTNLQNQFVESSDCVDENIADNENDNEPKTIQDIFFKSNSKFDSAKYILSSYSKNNKTASAAINELAVAMHWEVEFENVQAPHKKFGYIVRIGGFDLVSGEGDTKKEARQNASHEAIKLIRTEFRKLKNEDTKSKPISSNIPMHPKPTYEWPADAYCRLSMNKLLEIESLRDNKFVVPRRYAAFILTDHKDQLAKDGDVVAFGAGDGFLKKNENLKKFPGYHVTNFDSLILARRSLLCFFYSQLSLIFDKKLREGTTEKVYFVVGKNGKVKLKEGCRIHLYMSHAPHGDCVESFPKNWKDPLVLPPQEIERDKVGKIMPIMSRTYDSCQNVKQPGHIRVLTDEQDKKWVSLVEYRATNIDDPEQMVMSPSDKLMSWIHVGLQGALLSLFIDPVHLYSIQVANDYIHGHFSRALLCRVPLENLEINSEIPRKKDPFIARVSKIPDPILPLLGLKEANVSYNWYRNHVSNFPEIIDSETGLVHQESPFKLAGGEPEYLCSRLSKVCMLMRLKETMKLSIDYYCLRPELQRTRMLLGVSNAAGYRYNLFKNFSVDYRSKKQRLFQLLEELSLGGWAPNGGRNDFDLLQCYEL